MMHRPFCIVYYHAAVLMPAVPNFAWVAKLHHVLGPRHRRNLQVGTRQTMCMDVHSLPSLILRR